MQSTQDISPVQLRELVDAVYGQGPVIVRQACSDLGCATREFSDAGVLLDELHYEPRVGHAFRSYTIYYPEAKGRIFERREEFDPEKCNGATFRFCQEGWGLIQLQIGFQAHPTVDCRIAVNSESRAATWNDVYPDLQSPDEWDWQVVEKKAGRLIRLLRRLGKDFQANRGG